MSLSWFKSIWLSSEERALLIEAKKKKEGGIRTYTGQEVAEKMQEAIKSLEHMKSGERPYQKVIYDGNSLQVIFKDGSSYSKIGVTGSLFKDVRDAKTEDEIYLLLAEKVIIEVKNEVDSPEEKELVKRNASIFEGNPDFEVRNDGIYMKRVNLALPSVVASTFIEILEKIEGIPLFSENPMEQTKRMLELKENYHALKMFWVKLALNPLAQSREDLLLFVKKNDVRITRNGNLVLYRRIVSYADKTNNALTSFISQNYAFLKRKKKSHTHPRNFTVLQIEDGTPFGKLILWNGKSRRPKSYKKLGNLEEMYKDLPNQVSNIYTSAHNKGKMEIKIGGIYKIEDNQINLNNGLCAAGGLHAAAVDYNYSGFGDVPVVVLVNPSKAITVPTNDWKKLRTTEMFIAAVNDQPHGIHFDDGLSAFDDEYHDFTLGELEEAVKNKSFDKLAIQNNVPAVSLVDVSAIKDLLKTRVSSIV